jgi:hypothetical protein
MYSCYYGCVWSHAERRELPTTTLMNSECRWQLYETHLVIGDMNLCKDTAAQRGSKAYFH